MISLDKGGGLIHCVVGYDFPENPEPPTQEERDKHAKAWEEYRNSPEYLLHQEEIERRNR
jgi:hypothetical protein